MLKYLTKLAMEIFPSVLATIIGAYIVNHYISAKPAADAPTAAVSSTTPGKTDGGKADTAKSESKVNAKAGSTELASLPEPGVKAKGLSEKAVKTTSDGPKGASESLYEKLVDKPGESVAVPADTRRGPAVSRDKSDKPVAKSAAPAPAPAAPALVTATAPAEAAATPEERRDAADLARAAIERLRNSGAATQGTSQGISGSQNAHVQEAVRAPEPRGAEPRPDAAAPI